MTDKQCYLAQPGHEKLRYPMSLQGYQRAIESTDMLPRDDFQLVMLGLFGEVGSLMAVPKKRYREGDAFPGHVSTLVEEFGDVLWYFTTLCRRLDREVSVIIHNTRQPCAQMLEAPFSIDQALLNLGRCTGKLIDINIADASIQINRALNDFAYHYIQALRTAGVDLSDIIDSNWNKVTGRFLDSPIRFATNVRLRLSPRRKAAVTFRDQSC